MLRPIAVACLLALPTISMAQDMVFSPSYSTDCQQNGGSADACVGLSANMCMDQSEGGYSTGGVNGCLDREVTLWDTDLNAAYKLLLVQERTQDSASAADQPDRPSGEAALRDMQRAWIAYRD